MKTLIIYNPLESDIEYLVVDGDYSRFNGVCINSANGNGFEDEFVDFFFVEETGECKHNTSRDISIVEGKNWDKVAVVTWLP
jgi:hypothetical protein